MARPANAMDEASEWKAVLKAFRMYKAAYGDLKIPQRFVVPSSKPWPEPAWGMPLGKRVSAIRNTGKYVTDNPKRRKVLDDMGFIWRARMRSDKDALASITFQSVLEALGTYVKEYPQTVDSTTGIQVPLNFEVPDCEPWPVAVRGMPLGQKLAEISKPEYKKKHPMLIKKLEEVGMKFQDDSKHTLDGRFQKVYEALKVYKELNGDLLVPQPFIVPEKEEPWPESTWGLRLGARVNAIRSHGTYVNANPERRKMLDDLGFQFNIPQEKKKTLAAQQAAKKASAKGRRGGTTEDLVGLTEQSMDEIFKPLDFDAPLDEDDEDDALFGGSGWAYADGTKEYMGVDDPLPNRSPRNADLDDDDEEYDMTMIEGPRSMQEKVVEISKIALETGVAREITDDWRVLKGRIAKDYPWEFDDFGDDSWVFEDVVEAFAIYKNIYGDWSNFTNRDNTFVVPAPEIVDVYEDEDDEFYDEFETDASARAAAAIAAFEKPVGVEGAEKELVMSVETETATLPERKRLKDYGSTWPEHLAGMELGGLTHRIRTGSLKVGHIPERRAALDEIGFDWGDPKYFLPVPFEEYCIAFLAYHHVRGDLLVDQDFVIPDHYPWPSSLAGYPVGEAAKDIRDLQTSIEWFHLDKNYILHTLEFPFFWTVAQPIDEAQANRDMEEKRCQLFGHPDLTELPEVPIGLYREIVEKGPLIEITDDPRDWWRRYHNWDYVKDYWYQFGCRDNAFRLNMTGFPRLAQEHEDKHGIGLYKQTNLTCDLIEELAKTFESEPDETQVSLGVDDTKKVLEAREAVMHFLQEVDPSPRPRTFRLLDLSYDFDHQLWYLWLRARQCVLVAKKMIQVSLPTAIVEKVQGLSIDELESLGKVIDDEDDDEYPFDINDELLKRVFGVKVSKFWELYEDLDDATKKGEDLEEEISEYWGLDTGMRKALTTEEKNMIKKREKVKRQQEKEEKGKGVLTLRRLRLEKENVQLEKEKEARRTLVEEGALSEDDIDIDLSSEMFRKPGVYDDYEEIDEDEGLDVDDELGFG